MHEACVPANDDIERCANQSATGRVRESVTIGKRKITCGWGENFIAHAQTSTLVSEQLTRDSLPFLGRCGMEMADGNGEGIGSVGGFGDAVEIQKARDHLLHLVLLGLAVSDDG